MSVVPHSALHTPLNPLSTVSHRSVGRSRFNSGSCGLPHSHGFLKISCSFRLVLRNSLAEERPNLDVWQHRICQMDVSTRTMCGICNRLGHVCAAEDYVPAMHKRAAALKDMALFDVSIIPTGTSKCFYQYLPPQQLLRLRRSPTLFQHPPTMWYMRSAANPLLGQQCRALSPMDASHSPSALV